MRPPDERRGQAHHGPAPSKQTPRQGRRQSQYAGTCEARKPSTYGLTDDEMFAEAARLVFEYGFGLAEVREVLLLPTVTS